MVGQKGASGEKGDKGEKGDDGNSIGKISANCVILTIICHNVNF